MTAGISITINLPGTNVSASELDAAGVSVEQVDAAPPPPPLDGQGDAADLSDLAAAPPDVEGDAGFGGSGEAADLFAPPPGDLSGDSGFTGDDDGEPPPPEDAGEDVSSTPAAPTRKPATRGRRKKA
jgi:hypothetical protein